MYYLTKFLKTVIGLLLWVTMKAGRLQDHCHVLGLDLGIKSFWVCWYQALPRLPGLMRLARPPRLWGCPPGVLRGYSISLLTPTLLLIFSEVTSPCFLLSIPCHSSSPHDIGVGREMGHVSSGAAPVPIQAAWEMEGGRASGAPACSPGHGGGWRLVNGGWRVSNMWVLDPSLPSCLHWWC